MLLSTNPNKLKFNLASNSAEKKSRPSEGVAEGGFGGNSATPERIQKADSPAVLLVKGRTPQKNTLFILPARRSLGAGGEEKIGARKSKIVKKTFLRGGEVSEQWRGCLPAKALASEGLPYWGFCSKKVRTSIKKHRQFSLFVKS